MREWESQVGVEKMKRRGEEGCVPENITRY